jgi:outer membrane murein-binding lipoprotein Lpp
MMREDFPWSGGIHMVGSLMRNGALIVVAAGLLGGCASRGEDTGMRNEVSQLRADVQRLQQMEQANAQSARQAEADARAAADRAAQAEQQASAANERSERMYNRGLRK